MNKLLKKVIALGLSAALCLTGAGFAFADDGVKNEKDETVYVLAGADGAVRQVIVSDWLKNAAGEDALADRSALTDIENVKGDETYAADGEALTWTANGSDIYYRGTTDKELPVSLTVSYQLDGQDIALEDLVGKSGRVTIRFDYDNRLYELVELNGEKEKIYVPFAAVTGLVLDNDIFRNVEVTNGRVVNDGDHTAVVGVALPGMQENLGVDKDTLEVPSYVEITADATDFQMGMTVTLVTNQVFNAFEDAKLDSSEDVSDAVNQLTDALTQLTDGTDALNEGLATLLEKSGDLVSGVDQLTDGASALHDGASSLQDGADQLNAGVAELTGGLNTLVSNNDSLTGGAEQVFNTLLATATAQLKAAGVNVPDLTIENYTDALNSVLNSLSEGTIRELALEQVTAAVEANRGQVVEKVTEAVREQVSAQVTEAVRQQVQAQVTEAVRQQVTAQVITAATGLSPEDYQAAVDAGQITGDQQAAIASTVETQMALGNVQENITATTNAQMGTETAQTAITTNLDAQMQSENVQALISQNVEEQISNLISENMSGAEVQSKYTQAAAGRQTISELLTSLDRYNAFYTGLKTYTEGVSSAADGASAILSGSSDLCTGAGQLTDGAATLTDGLTQLQGSLPALVDGITQLHDGSQQLSDGLKQFTDEGVQKLTGLVDGDLDALLARLNAIMDVSRTYRSFTGLDDTMDGQVKFIYRTDEAK